MSTSRRTKGTRAPRVTPEMIALFKRIVALQGACTCEPVDWDGKYWERGPTCQACEEIASLDSQLGDLLALKPWQHPPAVENPESGNPYPPGSRAAISWDNDGQRHEAQARWRWLATAAQLAES